MSEPVYIELPNYFDADSYTYNVWQSTHRDKKGHVIFDGAGVDVSFFIDGEPQGHTRFAITQPEYNNSAAWAALVATVLHSQFDINPQ